MRPRHVLGKCTVWVVLVMMLVTSCAAPINKMKIEESKVDKKILTNGGDFYYQGKNYRYNTEGARFIESLTQGIPEAKFEIERYHEAAGTAKLFQAIGFGIFIAGIFVSETKSSSDEYKSVKERNEERSSLFLTFSLISFIPMLLSDAQGRKALNSLKRAIMYYNKSIDNK